MIGGCEAEARVLSVEQSVDRENSAGFARVLRTEMEGEGVERVAKRAKMGGGGGCEYEEENYDDYYDDCGSGGGDEEEEEEEEGAGELMSPLMMSLAGGYSALYGFGNGVGGSVVAAVGNRDG